MIRCSVNNDREGIISLWHESFGDNRKEIEFFLDNKYIPVIVAILGIALSLWQDGITPKSVACGLVSGLASTGAFELIRNISEA